MNKLLQIFSSISFLWLQLFLAKNVLGRPVHDSTAEFSDKTKHDSKEIGVQELSPSSSILEALDCASAATFKDAKRTADSNDKIATATSKLSTTIEEEEKDALLKEADLYNERAAYLENLKAKKAAAHERAMKKIKKNDVAETLSKQQKAVEQSEKDAEDDLKEDLQLLDKLHGDQTRSSRGMQYPNSFLLAIPTKSSALGTPSGKSAFAQSNPAIKPPTKVSFVGTGKAKNKKKHTEHEKKNKKRSSSASLCDKENGSSDGSVKSNFNVAADQDSSQSDSNEDGSFFKRRNKSSSSGSSDDRDNYGGGGYYDEDYEFAEINDDGENENGNESPDVKQNLAAPSLCTKDNNCQNNADSYVQADRSNGGEAPASNFVKTNNDALSDDATSAEGQAPELNIKTSESRLLRISKDENKEENRDENKGKKPSDTNHISRLFVNKDAQAASTSEHLDDLSKELDKKDQIIAESLPADEEAQQSNTRESEKKKFKDADDILKDEDEEKINQRAAMGEKIVKNLSTGGESSLEAQNNSMAKKMKRNKKATN